MKKVSVIIPCYNGEKFIDRCLNSLLNQTLNDIEIIVVNDGSTDKSLEILKKYKNIIVYDNSNKGIGFSRNFGLEKATSPFVCFVDIDDYVNENYCEILYNKINSYKLDMVICNYCVIEKNSCNNVILPNFDNTTLCKNQKILVNINLSPWNKIFRKDFLINNNIYFPESLKYEDVYFIIKSLKIASIGYISNILYNYVVNSNSETTSMDIKVFDVLKILEMVWKEMKDENNNYLNYFICREISIYNIRQRYQKDKKNRIKFIKNSFIFLNEKIPNYKKNEYYKQRSFFKRKIEKSEVLSIMYCNFYNLIN